MPSRMPAGSARARGSDAPSRQQQQQQRRAQAMLVLMAVERPAVGRLMIRCRVAARPVGAHPVHLH